LRRSCVAPGGAIAGADPVRDWRRSQGGIRAADSTLNSCAVLIRVAIASDECGQRRRTIGRARARHGKRQFESQVSGIGCPFLRRSRQDGAARGPSRTMRPARRCHRRAASAAHHCGVFMRTSVGYAIVGGLLGATFDIIYAFVFHGLRGVAPVRILQSIASGVLGMPAYSGGVATAILGAALHLAIVVIAALIFLAASRRWRWLIDHPVFSGAVFGLCMYGVMNFIVVPLSAFPTPQSFGALSLITGLLAHVFLVGLPIALCVRFGSRPSAAG
jgi:hypothetical protein